MPTPPASSNCRSVNLALAYALAALASSCLSKPPQYMEIPDASGPAKEGTSGSNQAPADGPAASPEPAPPNGTPAPDGGPRCGNGVIESGETCDPPESCVTSCSSRACTRLEFQGSPTECNSRCVESQILECKDGDGCCPSGCDSIKDRDCLVVCGNGVKEGSETCDPIDSCSKSCPAEGCQLRTLVNAGTCTAECIPAGQQTSCISGDGCCPGACNGNNDSDCSAKCGNGIKEGGETCDPCPASCPPQGCQLRRLEDPGTCNTRCVDDRLETQCKGGDGCCPPGCNAQNDGDCNALCGNGVKEGSETCDGNCPANCPSQGCQLRRLENGGTCNARCVDDRMRSECVDGDGCCPGNCNANNDNDCRPRCGNGVKESGEACDGDCPNSCPPAGKCRKNTLTGQGTCNARCVDSAITNCASGDGCCPNGCDLSRDTDCPPECSGAERRCNGENTLEVCNNGLFLPERCPGGGSCFPQGVTGGGQPECGCKRQNCRCDNNTDPAMSFLTTDCGVDGQSYQFICEGRPCQNGHCPDGDPKNYRPFCPNY